MRVHETCHCGATIEVFNEWTSNVNDVLVEWRANHNHASPPRNAEQWTPQEAQ